MEHKYGIVTIGAGTPVPQQVPIASFLQATFADNRLISIMFLEDGSYVLAVENPTSTGRAVSSTMRLSEESFFSLQMAMALFVEKKGINIQEKMEKASHKDKIEYRESADIFPDQSESDK